MDLVTMATAFFSEQAPEHMRRHGQAPAQPKREFSDYLEEALNGEAQSTPGKNDAESEAGYVA